LLVADGYSVYTSAGPQLISNEENTMRWMTMVSSAAVLVAVAGVARLARAEEVPIGGNSPTRVEGRCNEAGGVYFPPSSHGVYACLNSDGSGIICGGVGGFAKTCTTFGAQVVKGPKLPNRPAVIEAERQRLLKAQR
jgi:hypothetical protein